MMDRRFVANSRCQSPLWAVAAAMTVGGLPTVAANDVAAPPPTARSLEATPSAATPPIASTSNRSGGSAPRERRELRLREGSRLNDVVGRFRPSGDSLTFIDIENREIGGLPNLNLERIARTLQTVDEPESVTWTISGTVTEFSGKNYLLISRAVFRAAAPPPVPENIAE